MIVLLQLSVYVNINLKSNQMQEKKKETSAMQFHYALESNLKLILKYNYM